MRMSCENTIEHIQEIFNNFGDPVSLILNGQTKMSKTREGELSIPIRRAIIRKENKAFRIQPPEPRSEEDNEREYVITRIRISLEMLEEYSKGGQYQEEELIHKLSHTRSLFGYYAEDEPY